jgi:hypothetical protein
MLWAFAGADFETSLCRQLIDHESFQRAGSQCPLTLDERDSSTASVGPVATFPTPTASPIGFERSREWWRRNAWRKHIRTAD